MTVFEAADDRVLAVCHDGDHLGNAAWFCSWELGSGPNLVKASALVDGCAGRRWLSRPGNLPARADWPGAGFQVDVGVCIRGLVGLGHCRWRAAVASYGEVDFRTARFSGSEVSSTSTLFTGGEIDFSRVADWSAPPKFPGPALRLQAKP